MERAITRGIRPRPEIRAWSLRFVDAALEREFQDDYIRRNLPWIRLAHVFGMVTWAVFGLLAQAVLREGRAEDLVLRFGVAIPTVALSLGLTYAPWYPRVWQWCMGAVVLASAAIWSLHRIVVEHSRPDWGYAGIMLILAFLFTFSRVGFPFAAATAVGIIAVYNGVTIWLLRDAPLDQLMANYFVLSVGVLGMAASYWLDRSTRLVFLRERQVEDERRRADDLLRDILPGEIVDRLKLRDGRADAGYIAEGLDEVTVLFADLVGFTDQARRTAPQQLVAALDGIFSRFDEIAGRHRLEKIKTVGDAYMAVAGAPSPRGNDVEAAAETALDIMASLRGVRWPSGDPVYARVGIAAGPAVAGVIGRRRFAYDLWGDTVNLASRLEANGRPELIQVSETVYQRLHRRYRFSEPHVVDLKGKGPTPARYLLGRADDPIDPEAPSGGTGANPAGGRRGGEG